MSWLRGLALAAVLAGATLGCSSEILGQTAGAPGDVELCGAACATELGSGCVPDLVACIRVCHEARESGLCAAELDLHLACVAEASDLRCGRPPNGGACNAEDLALEHCILVHSVGDAPPDCWGEECTWECGPLGRKICVPGSVRACACDVR